MGSHRLLEHTADIGIEASAATPEGLFSEVALGLLEVLGGPTGTPCEERQVHLSGYDRGDLLVRWLNELLYLLEIGRFYPAAFAVEEAGPHELRALVNGEPFDPLRHRIEREVKAVTYHQLQVTGDDRGWRARVYLDL